MTHPQENSEIQSDLKCYVDIVHSRMNHVQALLSALCALEISAVVWVVATVLTLPDIGVVTSRMTQFVSGSFLGIVLAYGVLLWAHLFTIYQFYVVRKSAKVLQHFEINMANYCGPLYFNSRQPRYWLYYVAHGFPTLAALFARRPGHR